MTFELELTNEEVAGLRQLLKHVLSVKNVELHRTEAFAFKDLLKTNIELVEHILAKLEQACPQKMQQL